MVRSVPLRNFDQDMIARVVDKMDEMGVRFLNKSTPTEFIKQENGKILAKWTSNTEEGEDEQHEEEFDTVLMAVGRTPDLDGLNLEAVGVETKWKRVVVDEHYRTSAENIYALGDIIVNSPELTPVAIAEGKIIADRLYGGLDRKLNYDLIATTIFTPLEYSKIGLSEEMAIQK